LYDKQGPRRLTEILKFTPWDPGAGPPPLSVEGLHLWRIQAGPGGANPGDLWDLLSEDEQARAQRFANRTLRDRYLRAHGELRLILGLYLAKHPQDIVFSTSARGKPTLSMEGGGGWCNEGASVSAASASATPAVGLEFNLTGSHDLALVAIAVGHPVGVDCELIRPCSELLGIARRMFPPDIADGVACTPEAARLAAFYAAWTDLEARVKADGRGLFGPRDPDALPLTAAHCVPQAGYLAAVARHGLPPTNAWGTFEWLSKF
jgi:4'-phosphopantetheinyl transferase